MFKFLTTLQKNWLTICETLLSMLHMVSFSTSVILSVDITSSEKRFYSLPEFFIICYAAWIQITIIAFLKRFVNIFRCFLYATLDEAVLCL